MTPGEPACKSSPECPICNDAGFIHPRREDGTVDYGAVVPCQCQAEKMAREKAEFLLRYCGLPAESEDKTFKTFKERTEEIRKAKVAALMMAQGDETIIFLTLMSDTGLGKSHLAIAICRVWLGRGMTVKYCFVPELLDELRASYHRDETTGISHSQLFDTLRNCQLLVLDDLGTEKKSDWAREQLQSIIDHRARNAMPMVVTTNKTLAQLPNDDEGRIASRLQREVWCKVVVLE